MNKSEYEDAIKTTKYASEPHNNLEDSFHMRKLCSGLYKNCFLAGQFSDICITIMGVKFKLHRNILIQNEYFSAMLNGPWLEKDEDKIELFFDDPNITIEGITAVLARMYGSVEKSVNDESVISVLAASTFFGDEELSKCCLTYMSTGLSPSTVLRYLDFADNFYYGKSSDIIIDAIFNYLCKEGYTDKQLRSNVFPILPLKWLEKIVGSDCFFVPSEYHRYTFLRHIVNERRTNKKEGQTSKRKKISVINSEIPSPPKSPSTFNKSSPLPPIEANYSRRKLFQEFENLSVDDEDIDKQFGTRLLALLSKSIIFTHFTFQELMNVKSDNIVDKKVLLQSAWTAQELRMMIESSTEDEQTLDNNFNSDQEGDGEESANLFIPQEDTDKIDNLNFSKVWNDPPFAHYGLKFPPSRFGVDFEDLSRVHSGVRIYSDKFFYAGSQWSIYIQKVVADGSAKLGVYLQRNSIDEETSQLEPQYYNDKREQIQTWFKIFCFVKKSDNCEARSNSKFYLLESKPDVFKDGQSWGWRTSKLYSDALEATTGSNLRCSVILGQR